MNRNGPVAARPVRSCLMLLIVLLLGGGMSGCGGDSNPSSGPTLQQIKVTPDSLSTGVGIGRQLTAIGTYSDGSTAIITSSATWQSVNASVAVVTGGVVTGVALGSTTISASMGTVSANLPVNVTANAWSPCANMLNTSVGAAALLRSGKVLVVGISGTGTAPASQLYDPVADAWAATGPMLVPIRVAPATTLLADGRFLVAGGAALEGGGYIFPSAEAFDPSSNSWSAIPDTPAGGAYANTGGVLLPNGQALIAGGGVPGGLDVADASATADLYDPVADAWTTTSHMNVARSSFTLTPLQNGKVLAAGGYTPTNPGPFEYAAPTASSEIYESTTGTWTAVANMNLPRANHVATLLSNGNVLVISGDSSGSAAEIYDPNADTWTEVGNLSIPRLYFTATLLPSGKVIVAGGEYGSGALSSTELFDPGAGTWSPGASMDGARAGHVVTLLQNLALLVAGGGVNSQVPATTCELYW